MNEAERRVLELVEENWEQEVRFLQGLVKRPSTLGNEAQVQQFVARRLHEMGFEVNLWQVDNGRISQQPGYSPAEWSYEGRPNVAATWCSSSGVGKSLILNGHVDVVPATPEHHWTYDPWGGEIVNDRMYGRGSADMKAGVAAMLYAVSSLREAGIELMGDVTLETVIEEECTGNGTLSSLTQSYKADAAIIPEPSRQEALEAQVGVVWARVTIRGSGAHVQGADRINNPILKAYLLIQEIQKLEAEVNALRSRPVQFNNIPHPLNYNVGIIRAGDWASSVPSECVFEVRIPAYPGQKLEEVMSDFESRLLRAAREDSWLSQNLPEVCFYAFRAEGCVVDREEPIFISLRKAHQSVTKQDDLRFHASAATTDVRFFNLYHRIPATCYGPTGGGSHAPDEWVDLESVKSVTGVLALTIMNWCGIA